LSTPFKGKIRKSQERPVFMQQSLSVLPLFVSGMMLATAAPGMAQTVESSVGPLHATVLAEGLDHPWALAFLPGGRFLVTERSGRLLLLEKGVITAVVDGVPRVEGRNWCCRARRRISKIRR
jgi:glucose/arabinose dehydrogenase